LIISYESYAFFALIFTTTEFTTPFVNQRWFLEILGWKETGLYSVAGFLMWLSWSLVRIPLVPLTGYLLYINISKFGEAPIIIPFVCVFNYIMISILNSYWYYLISKGLIRVLFGKKQPPKSKKE